MEHVKIKERKEKKLDLEISFGNHRAQFIIGMRENILACLFRKSV